MDRYTLDLILRAGIVTAEVLLVVIVGLVIGFALL